MESNPYSQLERQERIRCCIIGAGVSGLLMAYKLKKHLLDYVEFQILEKSPELGGTWYENKYPGCGCDVPSHCYQYSFAPNPSWSKFYASSQEIKAYLTGVARHFELDQHITFNSKVISAQWSEVKGTWMIQTNHSTMIECEVLVNACGILNDPQVPKIDGLSTFLGSTCHTAAWDSSINLEGKKVAVIGAGASAIQLLPRLQPICKEIKVYIRTPSWISPPVALPIPNATNYVYNDGEKESFKTDGQAYLKNRKLLEDQFNGMFRGFFRSSPEQRGFRDKFASRMRTLIQDPDLQEKLIPKFEAGCRRINPGEQFLISLQEPNVEPVFSRINRITPTGVIAGDIEHPADILVLATGFNTSFIPRFPIIGRDSVNLQDLWAENPTSYWGTGVSGFPNYLIFLGPNTPISNGSLMGSLEATGDYFIRILQKMIRQRAKIFDVRSDAQNDFDTHTQNYMREMVWTGTCRSWYKNGPGGKVTALWPGSSLHYMQCLAEDRWEDYQWVYKGERFAYWGSGLSWIESPEADPLGLEMCENTERMTTIPHKDSDLSFYLWKSPSLPQDSMPAFEDANGIVDEVEGVGRKGGARERNIAVPV